MAAALTIADYFVGHAQAAFEQMGADGALDAARGVLQHLSRRGIETFTVRSLFSELPRTKFERVSDLMDALDTLEAHGWVIHLPTPRRDGPGRKGSDAYTVHPAAQSAQSAQSAETDTATSNEADRDAA